MNRPLNRQFGLHQRSLKQHFHLKLATLPFILVCILSPLVHQFHSSNALSLPSEKPIGRRDLFDSALSKGASSFLLSSAFLGSPPASAIPTLDGYDPNAALTFPTSGRSYFPTITPPFQSRATYRYALGRNAWALEQLLTFSNVTATVRTIVQKSDKSGGLWVHGPLYPTGEFCKLLNELGEVEHVVLPCNALEHKAPMQAFLKKYPNVKSVWVTPGQYGFFGSCGFDLKSCKMPYKVDGILPLSSSSSSSPLPPWVDEFEFRTLYLDLPKNAGPVSETAFFHKASNTLITTDSVVFVPDTPPPIFDTYFTNPDGKDQDFWPKTVLQSVFLPLRQEVSKEGGTLEYPGYNAIQNRLVRAPILRSFVDARAPNEIKQWVQEVSAMGKASSTAINTEENKNEGFDRILTAHFASPIRATPSDFVDAFAYLQSESGGNVDSSLPRIACRDWELLQSLNDFIDTNQLGAPTVFDYKKGCIP